jgi:hypothetical protein
MQHSFCWAGAGNVPKFAADTHRSPLCCVVVLMYNSASVDVDCLVCACSLSISLHKSITAIRRCHLWLRVSILPPCRFYRTAAVIYYMAGAALPVLIRYEKHPACEAAVHSDYRFQRGSCCIAHCLSAVDEVADLHAGSRVTAGSS